MNTSETTIRFIKQNLRGLDDVARKPIWEKVEDRDIYKLGFFQIQIYTERNTEFEIGNRWGRRKEGTERERR